MTFFIIAGVTYVLLFSPKIRSFFNHLYISKKEHWYLHRFYTRCFAYYNLLDVKEKRKFLIRIRNIRGRNELQISPEIKNANSDVELLICAAFAQITFGYDDYEIETFTRIIIRPNTFYSKLVNNEVKGLTLGTGYIFYSWEDFLKGYMFENDKINLALHELAHALYIDRFHEAGNDEWELWKDQATRVLELISKSPQLTFFRTYGKSNLHEFWAVSVECFFEDPVNYKQQHPHLYDATVNVLRQDMATRKMRSAPAVR